MFTLPSNFVASTTQSASELFTNLAPYITLIVGIMLGVVVIEILVGALRK
jgi:uncharacterized membrane-anchored protein YhcB (DUF1043 family)